MSSKNNRNHSKSQDNNSQNSKCSQNLPPPSSSPGSVSSTSSSDTSPQAKKSKTNISDDIKISKPLISFIVSSSPTSQVSTDPLEMLNNALLQASHTALPSGLPSSHVDVLSHVTRILNLASSPLFMPKAPLVALTTSLVKIKAPLSFKTILVLFHRLLVLLLLLQKKPLFKLLLNNFGLLQHLIKSKASGTTSSPTIPFVMKSTIFVLFTFPCIAALLAAKD